MFGVELERYFYDSKYLFWNICRDNAALFSLVLMPPINLYADTSPIFVCSFEALRVFLSKFDRYIKVSRWKTLWRFLRENNNIYLCWNFKVCCEVSSNSQRFLQRYIRLKKLMTPFLILMLHNLCIAYLLFFEIM